MPNSSSNHPVLSLQDARAKAKLKQVLEAARSPWTRAELIAFGNGK